MDRIKRTADVVKKLYQCKKAGNPVELIKEVCAYFDEVKEERITEGDLNFLLFIANEAGIPQYYDLLKKKHTDAQITDENITLLALSALLYDASLIRGDSKLHRYQKEVIQKFSPKSKNRYVLTAPTSFGKTFLVYEIIQKMQYQNVLLIFPAVSLLSENYAKLCVSEFFSEYELHSLSEESFDLRKRNIFIFTPERFLSFMDSHAQVHFDFAFIDEIYKIDNSFIIDQGQEIENERDTAYRLALEYACDSAIDMLLAGPYMNLPLSSMNKKESFYNFVRDNGFSVLEYNKYEIVSKEYFTIKGKQSYEINGRKIEIGKVGKTKKISNIVSALSSASENTIIYCGRKSDTETYAKKLLEDQSLISSFCERCASSQNYQMFLEHLESTFGSDWIVLRALQGRIGIHHSLIPKYIQKEIIKLFNAGALVCLFSTTTITEGVNTSAKNIVITSSRKGMKPLRQFDAKNIAGRAGRFQRHYSGRVIDLDNDFEAIVNGEAELLAHKNYDVQSAKTDVDYQITKEQYLSEADKQTKESLQKRIEASGIPQEVFKCFKIIGPRDKLELYAKVKRLNRASLEAVGQISLELNRSKARKLDWDGFQLVAELLLPIIHEEKLKSYIMIKTGKQQKFSLLTVLVESYLKSGFLGMVEYYTKKYERPLSKDAAIRKVADIVYNVFKYHLVKYLGLFDVLYRYHVSVIKNIEMDEVPGLGILLQKLEYNALTPIARKLSDYGVPFKLIDYYDGHVTYAKDQLDSYERYIDEEVASLLK